MRTIGGDVFGAAPWDPEWAPADAPEPVGAAGAVARATSHGAAEAALPELTPTERLRDLLIRGDDVLTIPPPKPLIAGLLDLDSLAVLYGPSGSGKSFVAIDWALSVATGSWWLGHEVSRSPVLYVAAEGVGGLGIRVRAWQDRHNVISCGETIWLPRAVNLLDGGWSSALATIVAEVKPSLIVLDTLARCLVGGDENTAKDIGMAVDAADVLRRASRACVLLVHHSGKDVSAGARGSSALKAAMSTEIECTSDDAVVTLRVTKQKDHVEALPIRLALVPTGDSCALDRYSGGVGLPDGAFGLLAELAAIDTGDGVASSIWMASSGVALRSFHRWKKGLLDEGYCHKAGERSQARYTITDLGKQELSGR